MTRPGPRRASRAATGAAPAALLAVALLTAALTGCSGGGPDFGRLGRDGTVLTADDRPTPAALAGPTLAGQRASTADLRGKVVVVNLWGSWCGPCQAEGDALGQVAREHPEVAFLGVDTRDVDTNALAFNAAHQIGYPSLVDTDGSLSATWHPFPPTGTPVTVVLDRQGRAAARFIGATTYSELTRVVTAVSAA